MKTLNTITNISMPLALTAALLSIIGIIKTGFYPGIIVLSVLALIAIASTSYAKRNKTRKDFQRNFINSLIVVNLLLIVVTLWMIFVIVHDRVLNDCC